MPDPADTAALLNALQAELSRQRVLIVDRHPAARDSLRLMLANLGITQVHGAGSAAEVLRQVRNNRFDIVLSDYFLEGERDGQQLLEELRHTHLLPLEAVYLIVTSERSAPNVASLAELTPDDYLIKPFTADLLQSRLVRALYKKRQLRPIHAAMARGDFAEALAACTRLLEENPAYPLDALRFKGELLIALERFAEARQFYSACLDGKSLPWAKMGLAEVALHEKNFSEAESLARALLAEHPDFLAAYDFLALVQETQGHAVEAQETLQEAARRAPNNSQRQRLVGDLALQNKDLEVAERAFGKVLERHRGSSLCSVDDYTSLSKVQLEKGRPEAARAVLKNLRRDLRGDKQGELAALVVESMAARQEGDAEQAGKLVDQALELHRALSAETENAPAGSNRLAVDLAHVCLENGRQAAAQDILRQVASEHHEDFRVISHIEAVFEKTGQSEAGRALLDEVGAELVSLNNQGVLAARGGDLHASVDMLTSAADRVPNVQFLVNAAQAIFTLMDQEGWNDDLAKRAGDYLRRALLKAPHQPKVLAAREAYLKVARKYGIATLDLI